MIFTTITAWKRSKMLSERREQTTIPFEEPEFAGKSVHGHLTDALISLKTMDYKNYVSNDSPMPHIENGKPAVLKEILDSSNNRVLIGVRVRVPTGVQAERRGLQGQLQLGLHKPVPRGQQRRYDGRAVPVRRVYGRVYGP